MMMVVVVVVVSINVKADTFWCGSDCCKIKAKIMFFIAVCHFTDFSYESQGMCDHIVFIMCDHVL